MFTVMFGLLLRPNIRDLNGLHLAQFLEHINNSSRGELIVIRI